MEKIRITRAKIRAFVHALSRVLLLAGAALMAAAVIWMAFQIFKGEVELDPDFPPEITRPDESKNDENITDNPGDSGDNGNEDPTQSGSNAIQGQAPSRSSQGSRPSTPPAAANPQPVPPSTPPGSGPASPDPTPPLPLPLPDPITELLQPAAPILDPLMLPLQSSKVGPVL